MILDLNFFLLIHAPGANFIIQYTAMWHGEFVPFFRQNRVAILLKTLVMIFFNFFFGCGGEAGG